ncbi:hypothetical protein TWF696_008315 [Orbilia brochopaga]|uniref:Uncharacterized protein n=1 Tax=Orbilia brochopaga TaxID=3140254 RepID=A0AAV9UFZ1_9PEZI
MNSNSRDSSPSSRDSKKVVQRTLTPNTVIGLAKQVFGEDDEIFRKVCEWMKAWEDGFTVEKLDTMDAFDTARAFGLRKYYDGRSYLRIKKPQHDIVVPARLREFIYFHIAVAWRQSAAVCRTLVDVILQEAIAIVRDIDPQSGIPLDLESAEKGICLVGEVGVEYEDEKRKKLYTGKFDHGIGLFISAEIDPDEGYVDVKPYHSMLAVAEAKDGRMGEARERLLGCLACIYRSRIGRGRPDAATYGVATDGVEWIFYVVRHDGTIQISNILSIGCGQLSEILEGIVFVLEQSQALITPAPSMEEGKDKQPAYISDPVCRPVTDESSTSDPNDEESE